MSGAAVGQIVGIPLGIALSARWGFRAPFYIFAVTMAATVALLWLRVPQPPVKRTQGRLSVGKAVADYAALLRRPEVRWGAAAYFTMYLGIALFVVYLPTWLEWDVGLSGNQIALMYLLGGIANVATGPQAGHLSDRMGRKRIILWACVGLSLAMAATPFVIKGAGIAYAMFFVVMVLTAMRISPFSALLTALVSDDRRGSLMSLSVALGQMGMAVGGAVAGPLYAGPGYASNAVVGALSVLAMGVIVWTRLPEPKSSLTAA